MKLRNWGLESFTLIAEKRRLKLCIVWHSLIEQIGTLVHWHIQCIAGLYGLELRLILGWEVDILGHHGLWGDITRLKVVWVGKVSIHGVGLVSAIH